MSNKEYIAIDEQNKTYNSWGGVGTLTTDGSSPKHNNRVMEIKRGDYMDNEENIRIRKLTPKECYRLMGFDDASFEKASKVNSNSQLYKQAGNSIATNVLVAIFGQMIEGKENEYKKDFNFKEEQ